MSDLIGLYRINSCFLVVLKEIKMRKFLLFSLLMLILSCSKKEVVLGKPIPADTKIVALKELVANPDMYHNKMVTLVGTVDWQCGNKCEFTYAEKGESHTIYVGYIEAPTISKGTPIKVMTHVFNGDKKLVLTAQGLVLNGKGGK